MAVFTFIVKHSGGTWSAKQHGGSNSLESSAASSFELQRNLSKLALQTAGPNTISSTFALITPTSAVYQVVLGGGGGSGGGAVFSGGVATGNSGGSAPTAVEEKKEEKVEEKEESDDDMGFSLFD